MTVRLEVNINDRTARILRWAELERGLSAQQVLNAGTYLLGLMLDAEEIYLVNQDGTREPVYGITPTDPGEIYDI